MDRNAVENIGMRGEVASGFNSSRIERTRVESVERKPNMNEMDRLNWLDTECIAVHI